MKYWLLPVLALLLGCKTSSTVSQEDTIVVEETVDAETEDLNADDASPVAVPPLVARSQIIETVNMADMGGEECIVEGSVQDLSTRQPLDGATVKLGESYSATTIGGRFKITGVNQGDQALSVQASGYLPLTEQLHLGPGEHLGITIGLVVDSE